MKAIGSHLGSRTAGILALSLALLGLTCGGEDRRSQMLIDVDLDLYCRMYDVNIVQVYLLKEVGPSTWCLLTDEPINFTPESESSIDDLDLESGAQVRLVLLGLAGSECICKYDKVHAVTDGAEVRVELDRPAMSTSCETPPYEGACR